MQPVGIQVAIVEPGAYETDIWTRNAELGKSVTDPSSPNAVRGRRFSEHIQKSTHKADAREVAQLILRIAENPHPKLRYVAGTDAKMQLALRTLVPWRRYERTVAKFLKIDKLD
jgi:NAD(P)-dependent dehydrogenase (short-subunit alcohol dehydrogenase family)